MGCCDKARAIIDPEDKDFLDARRELKKRLIKIAIEGWHSVYKCSQCDQYWWQETFSTGHYESSRYRKITKEELLQKFPGTKLD